MKRLLISLLFNYHERKVITQALYIYRKDGYSDSYDQFLKVNTHEISIDLDKIFAPIKKVKK